MAASVDQGCLHTFEEAKTSKTLELLSITEFNCEICEGVGHEYWECPTKKRLDAFAKNNGDSALWGAYKYHKYYKHFNPETRKLHQQLSGKFAGQKRVFKEAFPGSSGSSR